MRAEYFNAFLEPSILVIEKTLKVEATVGRIKKGEGALKAPISIIINMSGDLVGVVTVSISMETAKEIAAKMLNKEKATELNQDEKEALSELANMIIGNAVGKLYELGLKETFTPPNIVVDSKLSISTHEADKSTTIQINTGLGLLEMNILLNDERRI